MKEVSQAFERISRSVGQQIEAHTPIFSALDHWLTSLDQETLDRLAIEAWFFSNQLGSANQLKTPKARRSLRTWLDLLKQGKDAPFAEFAPKIGDGFNLVIKGQENLSKEPCIYVDNHPTGPMSGTWTPFVINHAICKTLNTSGYAPRWFLKDYSDSYILKNTPLKLLKKRACRMMAQSNQMLIIQEDRSTFPQVLGEAKAHLENGGSLAICFEENNNNQLNRARSGVGLFLRIITDGGRIPVVPIGCWKKGNNLNVNCGRPVNLGSFLEGLPADVDDKVRSQKVIDYVAGHIACLLPIKHRGVYSKLAHRLHT